MTDRQRGEEIYQQSETGNFEVPRTGERHSEVSGSRENGGNLETVRKIRAVLFDMDGVLIDTEKYLTRFWRQAAAEAGLLLSLEECYAFRSFAGKYAAPWFAEKYGEQYDYWAIRERRKELMQEHIRVHGIEKKDGVEEVLQSSRKDTRRRW